LSVLGSFKSVFVLPVFVLLQSVISPSYAQEDWVDYVTEKDKGVMSISLDLSLDLSRPRYNNLILIGGQFVNCMGNGFPTEEGLQDLMDFSDSMANAVDEVTSNRLVGFITYKCMGFDVYYVKDTVGLRNNITSVIEENYNDLQTYIEIKKDKSWVYYNDYMFPRDFSAQFLIDQNYLHSLVLQGDDLQGLRNVNHWIYFKSLKKRNSFEKKLTNLKFSLDSIAYKKDRNYPYELIFSRQDSITPVSIYRLTSMLRSLSAPLNGQYDGWSTEVKPKK
jgi:hypothetical protein